MNTQEYKKLADKMSPKSNIFINMLCAFSIGGLICAIGQTLYYIYIHYGINKIDASLLMSVTLVFLSAILTGIGVYDKIAIYGGAGTLVPITGFANSVVSAALEYKSEGIIAGMSCKMFSIAGPVLVFGVVSSGIYGVILYIVRLFYKV
jgi:stage V sporulation protein AC